MPHKLGKYSAFSKIPVFEIYFGSVGIIRLYSNVFKEVRKMTRKTKARKIARDARNGQFVKMSEAKRRPNTTVVETIKQPKR